jgi:transposase
MRKGFDGLHALISERLDESATSEALFVFTNRRHNQLKAKGFYLTREKAAAWIVSAKLEFRGICRFENRQNSGQRRRLLQTTAPAFLPSSIGATRAQRRIGGLDPGGEAGRERRLAQATGMPEEGWFSNRQTGPVFAPALTPG